MSIATLLAAVLGAAEQFFGLPVGGTMTFDYKSLGLQAQSVKIGDKTYNLDESVVLMRTA